MEIGELVGLNQIDKEEKNDKCPFCYEARHDIPGQKTEKSSADVRSDPDQLGCDPVKIVPITGVPYKNANHHLIPALQAYACVRRLVRMGNAVGYDINKTPNGLGLPTIEKGRVYYEVTYGKLPEDDTRDPSNGRTKRAVANKVMYETNLQWHVGPHNYHQPTDDKSQTEGGDKELGHPVSYDTSTIRRLLGVCTSASEKPICKSGNAANDFIAKMNEISESIKSGVLGFDKPYFVSRLAYDYAQTHKARRCLLYTSPSPRDRTRSRMPSSA